ncbi:MAG TPA: thioredoxin family protein [Burkholderiaceae bacterium]|nr:thioredoxin family protein [Burkholderiaceae bacterium]
MARVTFGERLRRAFLRRASPGAGRRASRPASLAAVGLALWLGAAGSQAANAAPGVVRVEHVEAELVADVDAIAPGKALNVALRLRHDPHWHTYWQVPGDSGLPTTVAWQLPAGFHADPLEWPLPQRIATGPIINYGYEGMVLLPTHIAVPQDLAVGSTVRLAAQARWLMCNDVCIPAQADLELQMPVVEGSSVKNARWAAAIAVARGEVPQPVALDGAAAALDGRRIRLTFNTTGAAPQELQFFPLEAGRIDDSAPQQFAMVGRVASLELTAADPVAADFRALRGVLVAYGGEPWNGTIDVALARGKIAAAPPPAGASGASHGHAAQDADAAAGATAAGGVSAWLALAGAFLGGMILNLMPCVFPVLSLKVIGIVQHGDDGPVRPYRHGIAFAAGTTLTFVALAGLLLALRAAGSEIGWGFQLQTPWVVAALTTLFFLIGLNLLGTFEFTFGARLANSGPLARLAGAAESGPATAGAALRGSFATGILAVIVAAPCTAPFMGAALGYAVAQPGVVALAVFAALGVGMAVPYLLLTVFPGWRTVLPRPGAWMLRLKQALAFPMFATCVWLLWVLGQQLDVNAVAILLAALVATGLAAWALGLSQNGPKRWRWLGLAAAVAAGYGIVAATSAAPLRADASMRAKDAGSAAHAAWKPWSDDAVQASLAAGRPVFVDFTAAWCVTCQANKRLVLHSTRVTQAFENRNVTRLVADWTRGDERITRELARHARSGVPMYLLYDRGGAVHVLPELLTEQGVIDALAAS